MCILWENLISKAPFYYKMMFSKHYKKMFCENIYHIYQHLCNPLNTNNIKTDRYTPKREYLPVHLPVYLPYPPSQPEHYSTATGTLFPHNRNIILALPEAPSLATSIRH